MVAQTLLRPNSRETTKAIKKMIKRIFAIPAAVPAIPPKPKMAAIMAMMRKVIARPNILNHLPFSEFVPSVPIYQATRPALPFSFVSFLTTSRKYYTKLDTQTILREDHFHVILKNHILLIFWITNQHFLIWKIAAWWEDLRILLTSTRVRLAGNLLVFFLFLPPSWVWGNVDTVILYPTSLVLDRADSSCVLREYLGPKCSDPLHNEHLASL